MSMIHEITTVQKREDLKKQKKISTVSSPWRHASLLVMSQDPPSLRNIVSLAAQCRGMGPTSPYENILCISFARIIYS